MTHLIVDNATHDDNSVVNLSEQKLDELQLFRGDIVLLKGKENRETICIVLADETCPNDHIRINNIVQKNLHVQTNDTISIESYQDVRYGHFIRVILIDNRLEGITEDLIQVNLNRYFNENYRPIRKGDIFTIDIDTSHPIEFQVIEMNPSPYCIVAPDTKINYECDSIVSEKISFNDFGGLEHIKKELQEFIQYPRENVERCVLKMGKVNAPRSLLLYGPPGCGKTLLAKTLANEFQMNVILIKCPELLAMGWEKSVDNIYDIFERAYRTAPSVIVFDDFDLITRTRNENDDANVNQVMQQIITEMDNGSMEKNNVLIIGATNRPERIDSTIFQLGRMDQMLYIPLPDERARLEIFKIVLRKVSVSNDIDMKLLANKTEDFTGADLIELCQRASKIAIRESIEKELEHNEVDPILEIRQDHFEEALKFARRSVTDADIHKYEIFAQTICGSSSNFQFPDQQQPSSQGVYTDDDDLYN